MLTNILYFIVSCTVLIISAAYLVKSLVKIARFLRISEFTAAFIIMAFATSVPELFVGISSALSNAAPLSLGNVIGSSILHLTLIMGIFVLIGNGIKISSTKSEKEIYFVLTSIILLILLYLIGMSLSRFDGSLLLGFFLYNSYRIFKKRKKYQKKFGKNNIQKTEIVITTSIFIISLFLLIFSSHFIVKYASMLANDLNIPSLLIGLFLLSFSTTLPEFAFGIRAIKMHHKELALGDLTGGVLTNLGLVIGLVAIISPITTSFLPFIISAIFLFVSAFIFTTFLESDKELGKNEGIALILLYILFLIIEIFAK